MTKPAKIINKKPGNNSLNGASLKNNHPKANEKITPKYWKGANIKFYYYGVIIIKNIKNFDTIWKNVE